MQILVTGGTGFIGSHTVVELLASGFEVIIVDNLINSSKDTVKALETITAQSIPFYEIDIRDDEGLKQVFKKYKITATIHFAALKAVGESTQKPLEYYQNNVHGSMALFEVMQEFNTKCCIFSSSASVYGVPTSLPITEQEPLKPTNPYGKTKVMIEEILRDLVQYHHWSVINLRYFNPIGAHASGLIGENPRGIPNNLVPYICQAAAKKLAALKVFGNDYATPDGTGVRDYLHVVDLAKAHVVALNKALAGSGFKTYNLGTGQGYSVMEVIKTFMQVNEIEVPYEIMPRRAGDISSSYADASLALKELGWQTHFTLADMLKDVWHWQQKAN